MVTNSFRYGDVADGITGSDIGICIAVEDADVEHRKAGTDSDDVAPFDVLVETGKRMKAASTDDTCEGVGVGTHEI